jgi:hypothetical protein
MKTWMTVATALLLAPPAFAKAPKITKEAATKIALERVKDGKILSSELEKEEGKQVWSFDIRAGDHITEVWIDAATGKVVKEQIETPADEKAEKEKDAAKKAQHSPTGDAVPK